MTRSARAATASIDSPPLHAVPPDRPARALGADVGRRPALVGAVVPLRRSGVTVSRRSPKPDRRAVSDARRSGLDRTAANGMPGQPRTERLRPRRGRSGQGDVGVAGVPAQPRPFRLAVPDEPEPRTLAAWTRGSVGRGRDSGQLRPSVLGAPGIYGCGRRPR